MTDNLPAETEQPDRETLYITYLAQYPTQYEAAIAAGYSEQYAKTSISEKWKSKRFLDKLEKHYRTFPKRLVPQVFGFYSKEMARILRDGDEQGKSKHIPKQILQMAGYLDSDAKPGHTTINVREVRNLMLSIQNTDNDRQSLPPEPDSVQDAEYEEG